MSSPIDRVTMTPVHRLFGGDVYAATMRHTGMIDLSPSASLTITLMAVPVTHFSSSGSEVAMVGVEDVPNFVKNYKVKLTAAIIFDSA